MQATDAGGNGQARLLARIDAPGPKRLLAIDGGGIRGLIAIEVLAGIETMLRARLGAGPDWVLADFFDYVGGTSTGAIIAAGLALGMPVAALRSFYLDHGVAMFGVAGMMHRLMYRFDAAPLGAVLRDVFGAERTLGSGDLKTLLLMTMRNASTDSPWPLSSNPRALFNDRRLADCNLDLPLWQIIRASTAAPTFFPPEEVQVGPSRFVFEDGGVTPYNNPAFLLFLMATTRPYRLGWATGAERLLLVSVGTGTVPHAKADLRPGQMNLLYNAGAVPQALMFSALNQQDLLCRAFGDCVAGPLLDSEIGDLVAPQGSGLPALFTYARYNAELTRAGLDGLGLSGLQETDMQRLDSVAHMDGLMTLGRAVAAAQVRPEHFARFIGPDAAGKVAAA